jgi:CO/xanthine dehydrogenase FAD-binding subunit
MTLQYVRPRQLSEALGLLAAGTWTVLAGGTDLYAAHVGRNVEVDLLDIKGLTELRGIVSTAEGWRIGAAATWSELIAADLPPVFDGLKAAAREVGGRQVQNAATVAGNLCNASPAADGVPPLLALEAQVELASASGTRRMPLADFVQGNRRTRRTPGELVVAIHVPRHAEGARSSFLKLGHRRYLVISIAMVAATLELDAAGCIARCAFAVGACSAVAQRLHALESRLVGLDPVAAAQAVSRSDLACLSPIDDVRGTAGYRLDAVGVLLGRAIRSAGGLA